MGVEIRTERLRLRPLQIADAPRIRALAGEFAVARWLVRVPHPYLQAEAERFVAGRLDQVARAWGIELTTAPEPIGMMSVDGPTGRETLGYWLGAPYRGRGYASEAARAVVDWAFGNVDGLVWSAFQGSGPSLRPQEKLDYRVTGRRIAQRRATDEHRPLVDTALPRAAWKLRETCEERA